MASDEQTHMDRDHIFAVNGSADFLDILRDLFQEEDFNVTTTNFVPTPSTRSRPSRPRWCSLTSWWASAPAGR